MDSPAGFVALGILVAWLAYFVPGRLRDRAQLAQARSEDRFSASLRVLAVAGGVSLETAPGSECSTTPGSRTAPLLTAPHGAAARPSGSKGVHDMERSGISAARREQLVRRSAAAKRRAVLTSALAGVTLVAVIVAAFTSLPVVSALVPVAMLAVVLLLGRRAVIGQKRADAELVRRELMAERARVSSLRDAERVGVRRMGRPAPVARPQVSARAGAVERSGAMVAVAEAGMVRTGTARIEPTGIEEAIEVVPSEGHDAVALAPGSRWSATRVPQPVYATKAAAPRWEPAPLSAEIERVSRTLARWDAEQEGDQHVTPSDTGVGAELAAEQGTESLGGIELRGILERRRAVGE